MVLLDRLVKLSLIADCDAEIIVEESIVGIDTQCIAILLDRFIQVALLL